MTFVGPTSRRIGTAMALAAGMLALGPVAHAQPSLQVDTQTGVQAGQSVTVSLAGLPPNLPMVTVGQCKAQITGPTDCNLPTALLGTADGTGRWQPNEGKNSISLSAEIGGADCAAAPGTCTLAVTSLTDPTAILTSVPLTFGAPAPAPVAAPAAESTAADESGDNSAMITGGVAIVVLVALVAGVVFLVRSRVRGD